jgi:hypothetical protein
VQVGGPLGDHVLTEGRVCEKPLRASGGTLAARTVHHKEWRRANSGFHGCRAFLGFCLTLLNISNSFSIAILCDFRDIEIAGWVFERDQGSRTADLL